jgi:hypothetical protein
MGSAGEATVASSASSRTPSFEKLAGPTGTTKAARFVYAVVEVAT